MLTSLLVRFESGGIQHVVEYYCTQTNEDDGNDVDGIVKCSLWRIVRYLQHTYTLIRCRLTSNYGAARMAVANRKVSICVSYALLLSVHDWQNR